MVCAEIKKAGTLKKRVFEKWLQAKSVVTYDNYSEKRKKVKRVGRKVKRHAVWFAVVREF